jgi:hypothetical protein
MFFSVGVFKEKGDVRFDAAVLPHKAQLQELRINKQISDLLGYRSPSDRDAGTLAVLPSQLGIYPEPSFVAILMSLRCP